MKNIKSLLSNNLIGLIVISLALISGAVYFVAKNTNNNQPKSPQIDKSIKSDETGYIYVDGGAGILTNQSQYGGLSYIGESARGTEAYLADEGIVANYEFTAEKAGSYRLEISLSDDGLHDNGARNATVTLNNSGAVFYKHTSEDTKGWKWYSLGQLSIKNGKNAITFTKDESTTAAFVMNQFRLIPVVLSE